MSKSKTYTIRYYVARVGADGKQGKLAPLLQKIMAAADRMGPVREAGTAAHQIRLHESSTQSCYNGFFVRLREELPVVGERTTTI